MKYLSHILVFLLGCLLTYCGTEEFKEPCPQYVESPKVDSIKKKIEVKEKEVEVLKEEKKGITYTTKFKGFKPKKKAIDTVKAVSQNNESDTLPPDSGKVDCDSLAQIIYDNLLKCDTSNQISDKIIANQDSIIADQKEVITLGEIENASLKNEVKKQKRKNIITRFGAGIIIVAILLLK
jgi:hypothetical protein